MKGPDVRAIAGAVTFYFVVSLCLVFLNKLVMSSFTFPFPLFVIWFQLWVSFLFVVGLMAARRTWGNPFAHMGPDAFPALFVESLPRRFHTADAMAILELTLVFVGMVVFNNLTLFYVKVSFYQVARSLTILFAIIFTYAILKKSTSKLAMAACLIVILGFVLGVQGELDLDVRGVICGLASSAFVALYGIFVKRVSPRLEHPDHQDKLGLALIMYNNGNAIVVLLPFLFLSGEAFALWDAAPLYDTSFWMAMVAAGCFGFFINFATFLQIRVTSPLTHNLIGTVKACVQTALGAYLFGERLTATFVAGTGLVLAGSFYYSYVRHQEMMADRPASSTSPLPTSAEKR